MTEVEKLIREIEAGPDGPLKDLTAQRNKLLAMLKEINDVSYPVPELDALIRECEGREQVKQSGTFALSVLAPVQVVGPHPRIA